MQNKVQLITYADRLGGMNLSDLSAFLKEHFPGLFPAIHLLPFFYPIDGADAGYDPMDNRVVDARLGKWSDVHRMSHDFDLMADLIVNHISDQSKEFQDLIEKGSQSRHADLFLTKEKVYGPEASKSDLAKIFRPRPTPPFTQLVAKTGEHFNLWTTFSENQIDIDVNSLQAQEYLESVLQVFAENGVRSVRLDAVGYCVKKAGTSCFMLPETYQFIDKLVALAREKGLSVLTEIHSHYKIQIAISKHTDFVYDFALPPLLIYCIEKQNLEALTNWLEIRPRNTITVLDTHDGIGVMDLAGDDENEGLLDPDELEFLVGVIHRNTQGKSNLATGVAASNLDVYQVNSTYYDALGRNAEKYLLARAIQFFLPGIPQVYYIGWLGLENDMDLLQKTGVGRDINRSYLEPEEILNATKTEMVQELMSLIRFRNKHSSFNGEFSFTHNANSLRLRWETQVDYSELEVDFENTTYKIFSSQFDVNAVNHA